MSRVTWPLLTVAAALSLTAVSPPPPSLHPTPPTPETKCAACHTEEGWGRGRFAHERTGFALSGQHEPAPCKACHGNDFRRPQPRRCDGCHVDPHAGRLGAQCAECHDELSWRSRFDALAHRGSAFPLSGRHAALPCAECHGAAANDRFTRRAAACVDCHERDVARTVGTPFNHRQLRFGNDCRQCHGPWRFRPATLPGHDACFPISGGAHLGVRCDHCHSPVPAPNSTQGCVTGTALCTACHTHACAVSDRQHRKVEGYQCLDSECYACHAKGTRK